MAQKKSSQISKKENQRFMFIVMAIMLVLLVISYLIMGLSLTIVLGIGIGMILLIARFLDHIKSKPKQRKVFNFLLITFLILSLLVCVAVVGFGIYIMSEAPKFDITYLDKRESSIMYDGNNNEVIRLGAQLRENVTYDDLPEVFVDALIATEDARFFQHNGFDAPRFIKASIGQLTGNKNAGGASTLSMQVVKNTYTSTEAQGWKGIVRKFTDIYLAVFKLEKDFTKEQIIEYYVNNHDLGSMSFGVEQASQTYFGKSVKDINLSEAAILVGIFNAPTYYSPIYHPDRTYERRKEVLRLMVRHGYITQEEADQANAIPITSLLKEQSKEGVAFISYIDTVVDELMDKRGINPYITPVEIYTNMDRERQQKIDNIFNGIGFTWKDDKVQSGVAVVEVDTGKIVAVGGGRFKSKPRTTTNYATQAKRQIGSTAKPIFDYGPAIEYENWSTYTQILDEPYSYSDGTPINNSDRGFMGQISLRTALAQSRNIPALKAFQSVDNKKIIEFAQNLGIEPEISNGRIHEAHSIGAYDGTTPLMMAAAYAALANGGTYYEPLSINKIIYRETGEVVNYEPKSKKAMSDATAFMITDVLITAVESGLSNGAQIPGVTVAAKTGTTNFTEDVKKKNNLPGNAVNDAWIVGYDPQYAISMWYGYEKISEGYNTTIQAVNGRSQLYKALGNAIFNKNGKPFEEPSSVVKVGIEIGSNPAALPSANTPSNQITYEYFKKGTEPTETSTRYSKLDTVTGLNVNYSKEKQKITITWNKLNKPTANDNYGDFGYNVYYGEVLLGFTTNNSYTIDANTNISGTYKVVTTFSNYTLNQSTPAIFEFNYENPEITDTAIYTLKLVGDATTTITTTDTYTDPTIPVELLKDGIPISKGVMIKTVIKDPNGTTITNISGDTTPLTVGTYTITYTATYDSKTYTKTRQIIVQ
ncbi:MAG: transglycosylase domain-containing protein [bacterium]|nr:transglycosylase domain-containing protein [bacterium]